MTRLLAVLCALSAVALPAAAHAADFHVTSTADTLPGIPCADPAACSLRGAIDAANISPGADRILVAAGTYLLEHGELASNQQIEVTREGAGTVTFDGGGVQRVLRFGAAATVADVTIANGRATQSPSDPAIARGGGIYAADDLVLDGVTVRDSVASGTGQAEGGGVWIGDVATIRRSAFRSNRVTATGPFAATGGGLKLHGTASPTVEDVVFRDNEVTSEDGTAGGGGLWTHSADIAIEDVTFDGNAATASGAADALGGGWLADPSGGGAASTTITRSRVTGNTAESTGGSANGGGVHVHREVVTVVASTFDGNEAVTRAASSAATGGGLSPSAGLTLRSSTFVGNTVRATAPTGSAQGGAFVVLDPSTIFGSTVTRNTSVAADPVNAVGGAMVGMAPSSFGGSIVSGNVQGQGADCIGPAPASSAGGNVMNAASCGFAPLATDVVTTDPGVGPLGDHGGPTPTALLDPTSPALDRIAPAGGLCTGLGVDQRGIARPQGAACDAGAVEMRPAAFSASPAALAFGAVPVHGMSPGQDATLTNDGDLPGVPVLTFTGGGGAGTFSFSFSGGCGTTVPRAGTCTIEVRFWPFAVGPATSTISGATPGIALSGSGVANGGGGAPGAASVPQCRDLDVSTQFGTPATVTLECSETVWHWDVERGPQHGTLSPIGADGRLTYTPDPGFSGDDRFTYVARGGAGASGPATVVVHVGAGPARDHDARGHAGPTGDGAPAPRARGREGGPADADADGLLTA